jgi:cytochrome c5
MSAETSPHDPEDHASFIKTPQQLITIVVLAFVVPVVLIIMLAKAVVSGRAPEPGAMAPEAVAARIKPVADVAIAEGGAAGGAPKGAQSGEQVYKAVCAACHQTGVANAPKFGDKAAWAVHVKEGLDTMVKLAISGIRAMPPRGGNPNLSDIEVTRAVVHMANAAGASFKEPAAPVEKAAAPAAPAAPAQPTPAAAAPAQEPKPAQAAAAAPAAPAAAPAAAGGKGKQVYDQACVACHGAGVAGAPKFGDKAAWAPRIKTGVDALYTSSLKGKGAMPPKGGQVQIADADIKAAVDYMVAAAK